MSQPSPYLLDSGIDQKSGQKGTDTQKGVTGEQSSTHLRWIDANRNGTSIGSREYETVDHLTNTEGFPLVR